MPTKEEQLQVIADTVIDVVNQEIPDATKWNHPRDALQAALPLIGQFLDTAEAALAALQAVFNQDHDPVTGKNPVPAEWVPDASAPTFLNAAQFRLAGDRRSDYAVGHRVRVTQGAGLTIIAITGVGFDAGQNATTITVDAPVLASNLSAVARALVRYSAPKVLSADIVPEAVTGPKLAPRATVAGVVSVPMPNPHPFSTVSQNPESPPFVALEITTAGGYVEIGGDLPLEFTGGSGVLRVRLKRGGQTIYSKDFSLTLGTAAKTIDICPHHVDAAAPAGTHTYTLTLQLIVGGNMNLTSPIFANQGAMYAKESR